MPDLELPLPAEHAEAMQLLSRLAVLLSGMTAERPPGLPSLTLGDMFARQVGTMKAAVDGHGRREMLHRMTQPTRLLVGTDGRFTPECGCTLHPDCLTCCRYH